MSDTAIAAIGSVLSAALGVLNTYMAHSREQKNAATRTQVDQLEKNTNGINAALLKVTGESEFAKGVKQGEEAPKL